MNLDNLSEMQLDVLSKSIGLELLGRDDWYIVTRKQSLFPNRTGRANDEFVIGSHIVTITDGVEKSHLKFHGRVIGNLEMMGLLQQVKPEHVEHHKGYFYRFSSKAHDYFPEILELSSKGGKTVVASWDWLIMVADKWGCEIELIKNARAFKLIRKDGREFIDPFITSKTDGSQVYRLRDLSRQEWEEQIIDKIRYGTIMN